MLKSIPPEEKKTYVTLYKTNGYSYTMTLLAIIAEFVYVTTILDSMEGRKPVLCEGHYGASAQHLSGSEETVS